ncbi:hypothetical protein [Kribbella sp. NPDC050459]|uniref:hypothetical protein n=1 Tax=Kribbella sp. NPDC050459 TaxID=3155785 RepID=UPI0033C4A612
MNAVSSDSHSLLISGERQRMMVAHLAASKFFRRELLRANVGWPIENLKDRGVDQVLSTASNWKIGYAPDSHTRLTDHLREKGFDFRTLIRAGLSEWTDEGVAVDVFRDQLMVMTRNDSLEPVGFVGIGRGPKPAFQASPTTLIHRPASVLGGVEEQLETLSDGAFAVVVNDPLDAVAVESLGRISDEPWAGIPLCGSLMSSAQARILYRYTATDTVVVALDSDQEWHKKALAALPDLSYFYKRVRAVEIPDGHSPSSLLQMEDGAQRMYDAMRSTRPLEDYTPRAQQLPEIDGPSPASVTPTP